MNILLEVPYSEKDEAKALGARWNPKLKKWFITNNDDIKNFKKWMSQSENAPEFNIKTPVLLFKGKTSCWRCHSEVEVSCIGSWYCYEDGEYCDIPTIFSYLKFIPNNLKVKFADLCPSYYPDFTKTSKEKYFTNHCQCGAKIGDFQLHSEPGSVFSPLKPRDALRIECIQIQYRDKYCGISATPNWMDPNYIFQYTQNTRF